jgi:hypothetical protein
MIECHSLPKVLGFIVPPSFWEEEATAAASSSALSLAISLAPYHVSTLTNSWLNYAPNFYSGLHAVCDRGKIANWAVSYSRFRPLVHTHRQMSDAMAFSMTNI